MIAQFDTLLQSMPDNHGTPPELRSYSANQVGPASAEPQAGHYYNIANYALLSCARELTAEQSEASVNTLLLAVLYGTGTVYLDSDPDDEKAQFPIDIRKNTDLWYTRYVRLLSYCGWGIDKMSWLQLKSDEPVQVADLAAKKVNGIAKESVDRARDILRDNPDDSRMCFYGVLDRNSRDAEFSIATTQGGAAPLTLRADAISCWSLNVINDLPSWYLYPEDEGATSLANLALNSKVYNKRKEFIANGIRRHKTLVYNLGAM